MPEGSFQTIEVRVIPRARHDEVAGTRDGRLIVRTTAPPVSDKANEAVRCLIAQHFGVRTRDVEILTGQHSRDKVLRVRTAQGPIVT